MDEACVLANAEVSRYADYNANGVPTWLVITYVTANLILNSLNYFWFSKMVETVLKRFREPAPAPAAVEEKKKAEEEEKLRLKENLPQNVVLDAANKLEEEEGSFLSGDVVDGEPRRRKA